MTMALPPHRSINAKAPWSAAPRQLGDGATGVPGAAVAGSVDGSRSRALRRPGRHSSSGTKMSSGDGRNMSSTSATISADGSASSPALKQ